MTRRSMKGLFLINGLLLLALAAVTFGPSAIAQQSRFRGNYAMVSGRAQGSSSYILYIIDQNSRELVAIRYDTPKRVVEGMGYADLITDAGIVTKVRK
ncbi:MAG: hypothetical protein MK085_00565 [Phycisphaerales bacterium]|nr:hypothetical protein [Phycisphaerales bacterium]